MQLRTIQETGKLIAKNVSRFLDCPVQLSADGWLSVAEPICVIFDVSDIHAGLFIQFTLPIEDVKELAGVSDDQLLVHSLRLAEALRYVEDQVEEQQ